MAPHIAEELWERLGKTPSVAKVPWPAWREEALQAEEILVVVQVNGKLRGRLTVPADISNEELERAALADAKVQSFLEGKPIRKVIVVPKKLVNIVV
jgi:leucyl-tRNA synthetase